MAKRNLTKQLNLIPTKASLDELRQAAKSCKNCDLWKLGTQTVFGEGAAHSKLMLVGEQPGDQEDLAGKPFVGPAGKLLDTALSRSRNRPQKSLRHQRRKTFQVGASRQTPHPQKTQRRGNRCLPPLAGFRNRRHPPQGYCLSRRHSSPSPARQRFSRHSASRRIHRVHSRALRRRHRTSILDLARAR